MVPPPPPPPAPADLSLSRLSLEPAQTTKPAPPPTANGGHLLPFSVTPPKSAGPSEAERKMEALTRQIEEQMEQQEKSETLGKIDYDEGQKKIGATIHMVGDPYLT